MYTAIIADDENKICQLIIKLGNWEKLGIEIIEICNHGKSAIEAIEKYNPDICITDIKMPLYDGIQIISMAKEMKLDTSFIIISGYRHFEYAHSAVKLGAIDYLLKPIDKEQLNAVLEKVCQVVDERRIQHSQMQEYRVIKQDRAKYLNEYFWQNLLHKKHLSTNVEELNKKYDTGFIEKPFFGIFIKTNQAALHTEDSLFGEKVCEIVKELFTEYPYSTLCTGTGIRIVAQFETLNELLEKVNMLFFKVKNLTAVYGKFDLNIGCGSMAAKPDDIAASCEEAWIAYKAHLAKYRDTILAYDKIEFTSANTNILTDSMFIKRIIIALEAFNKAEMSSLMKEFEIKILEIQNCNPIYIEKQYHDLLSLIAKTIYIEEPEAWILKIENLYDYCRNYSEICHMIKKATLEMMTNVEGERRQRVNKPVRDVKQYIRSNYHKQLSLIDLSVVVDLNPVYLSKLFKQQVGRGIVDYLTDIRIEESKKLLLETNKTMMAIATETGFTDDKYFSKQFKKLLGISPSEYRKLHV